MANPFGVVGSKPTLISFRPLSNSHHGIFYFEAYEQEFDGDSGCWRSIKPEFSFHTDVSPPVGARLSGFDVVTFFAGTSPECSPLSCNGLAAELPVNELCLFDTFEQAKASLEKGEFSEGEPGPYRIIAVYSV